MRKDCKVVAVGHAESLDLIEVIVTNPVMINAHMTRVPGNGKLFSDGSKMATIYTGVDIRSTRRAQARG